MKKSSLNIKSNKSLSIAATRKSVTAGTKNATEILVGVGIKQIHVAATLRNPIVILVGSSKQLSLTLLQN